MPITYVTGDAADPEERPVLILHIVNNKGGWGAGFTASLSARWPKAESSYRTTWYRTNFGRCVFAVVDRDVFVGHLFAQNGYKSRLNPHPLNLTALGTALERVAEFMQVCLDMEIVMPRIGCGLAGGTWEEVEPLVQKHLAPFTAKVYDLR